MEGSDEEILPSSSKGPPPTISSGGDGSMENKVLYLPITKEGVSWLGDLWDCRASEFAGHMFKKSFQKSHLRASPIQNLNYDLTRVKDSDDFVSALFISVELGIDAAGGKVKFRGKARFDRDDRQEFHKERIICNYDLTTFQVALRQHATVDDTIVDKIVLDQILNGSTNATHYVDAIYLGGQAQATIDYYKNIDFSHFNIMGSLEGSLTMGPITGEAKASLELLDDEYDEQYTVHISVHAQPSVSTAPTDCESMFEAIETLDEVIDAEIHFPQLSEKVEVGEGEIVDSHIYGVPLRFRLVPINRISLDEEEVPPKPVEGKYKVLDPELAKAYSSMVLRLDDLGFEHYVKQLLARRQPMLNPILQDPFHPWTLKVTELASELMAKASPLKVQALDLFQDYKYGESTAEELRDLVELTFPATIPNVEEALIDLELEGRRELIGFRAADMERFLDEEGNPIVTVAFLTNSTQRGEWYSEDKVVKLLLLTNSDAQDALMDEGKSIGGIFLKLFDSALLLKGQGIEVGMALPAISEEFALLLKTDRRVVKYTTYEDMDFAIDLLRTITLTNPPPAFQTFILANCELSSLAAIHPNSVSDFPTMFRFMMSQLPSNAVICETAVSTLAFLEDTDNTTWNFVTPLDAKYRVVDAVRLYREYRYAPSLKTIGHNWVFGSLEIASQYSSPLFFVFQGASLRGVIFDSFDFNVFLKSRDALSEEERSAAMALISFEEAMVGSLYVDQWNYATYAVPNWVPDHRSFLSEIKGRDETFQWSGEGVAQALSIVRTLASRNEALVLNELCSLADAEVPIRSEAILARRLGWNGKVVDEAMAKGVMWGQLETELVNMVRESSVLMAEVVATLEALKELSKKGTPPEKPEEPEIPDEPEDPENPEDPDETSSKVKKKEDEEEDPDDKKFHAILDQILAALFSPPHRIPEEWAILFPLKARVDRYTKKTHPKWFDRVTATMNAFDAFLEDNPDAKSLFNVGQLIAYVKHRNSLEPNVAFGREFQQGLAQAYIGHLFPQEDARNASPEVDEGHHHLLGLIEHERYYSLLIGLDSLSVHPKIRFIQSQLSKASWLPSPELCLSLLGRMGTFNADQLRMLWGNSKFLYLVRQSLGNSAVPASIYQLIRILNAPPSEEDAEDEGYGGEVSRDSETTSLIPAFIPEDIAERVRPFFERRIVPSFAFKWGLNSNDTLTLGALVEWFESFVSTGLLPPDFHQEFTAMIQGSRSLEAELETRGILYHWEPILRVFSYSWTLETVTFALRKLKTQGPILRLSDMKLATKSKGHIARAQSPIRLQPEWRPFTKDGTILPIDYQKYFEVSLENSEWKPHQLVHMSQEMMSSRLWPFWVSRLKAGIFDPLRPEKVQGSLLTGTSTFISTEAIVTLFANVGDTLSLHRVLQGMAEEGGFGLPLVVPGVTEGGALFLNLSTFLKGLFLPSIYGETLLFTLPVRLVVTLKIGKTFPTAGRSSLLNSLLTVPRFASLSRDTHVRGTPLGRAGYLEVVPISKDTSSPELWSAVEDIGGQLILGSWHGDAIEDIDADTLRSTLKDQASSVVVFWSVRSWVELRMKRQWLAEKLGDSVRYLRHVVLYPDLSVRHHVADDTTLLQFSKTDDDTKVKLAEVLAHAFIPPSTPLVPMNEPWAPIIDLVKRESLHKLNAALKQPSTSPLADELLLLFADLVFIDDPQSRGQALYFASLQLDMLSQMATKKILDHLADCRGILQETYRIQTLLSPAQLALSTGALVDEIRPHLESLDMNRLSVQDLIYHTGKYLLGHGQPSQTTSFCRKIGEVWGDSTIPIDLETSMSHSFLPLWKDILDSVPIKENRVFVLSIIGPKGSGKTSLLHKLFGPYIPSLLEWGPTKGIHARLLSVEGSQRNELEADVILLLDCEGFVPPENWDDSVSSRREKNLTSFILQVSDCVLVNTLGGAFNPRPVLEALQVSLLSTLSTPNQASLVPRLILVHQLLEKDDTPLDLATGDLVDLVRAHSIASGLKGHDQHRLSQVTKAILSGKLQLTIQPRNDESHAASVAELMENINKTCIDSRPPDQNRRSLEEWSRVAITKWEDIVPNNTFPTSFQDLNAAAVSMGANKEENNTTMAMMDAILAHEKTLYLPFKIALDQALSPPKDDDEGDEEEEDEEDVITSNVDFEIDGALAKIRESLLNAVNICDLENDVVEEDIEGLQKTQKKLRKGHRSTGGPAAACAHCKDALSLKEAFLQKASLLRLPREGEIQEAGKRLERSLWEHRFNAYSRFLSYALSRQIKGQKSRSLADLVHDWLQEGNDAEVVFNKMCQHLSSLTTLPNSAEQLYFELCSIFDKLQDEVVAHLHNPLLPKDTKIADGKFHFGNKDVFIPTPFLTEGATMDPLFSNRLNGRMIKWFRIKLERICNDLVAPNLTRHYYAGMGTRLKERVDVALEDLKLELKAFKDAEFTLGFVWGAHVYAGNYALAYLKKRQSEWEEDWDPTTVFLGMKEFMKDPDNFFRSGTSPPESQITKCNVENRLQVHIVSNINLHYLDE